MPNERERLEEHSKFVPHTHKYEIVSSSDKAHQQTPNYQQQHQQALLQLQQHNHINLHHHNVHNHHLQQHFPQARRRSRLSSIASYLSAVPDEKAAMRGVFHQILSTCAVLVLSAACGMPIGYSAVILPQLSDVNSTTAEIAIDVEMGSWIASVHSLATPVGSLISGSLADYLGRRSTLLISIVPLCMGWCTLALTQSFGVIILGRVLCGFSTGLLGGPAQVYIAETAEPNLRSILIGAPYVSYSLGILIVYSLGSALHWRKVAWCACILPLCAAVAIFLIPETPAWLLRNNKQAKAQKALTFLRGSEIIARKEINDMTERLSKERATTRTNENIFQLCTERCAMKPLFIVIVFSILQMMSGSFIVIFYAVDIIADFGADVDTKSAAIWTAVVRMLCALTFCVILLFVRRRRILAISSIGSGLSCLILSIYMFARLGLPKSNTDALVAAGCLFAYIAFNTAIMVLPGIMIGELFPARIRGRTAGGVFAAMNVSLFALTKIFPMVQSIIKMRGVFMVFALSSFMVTIFMGLFQPETKGRSLDQIEDYFNENNWLWFKRDKRYKEVALNEKAEKAALRAEVKA
ncbi:facilitated trehalose transporter Tret1-2 homolog [Bactrocera neohumeralis]|uniref:facilitated trehalose transporter Tret1-2 homolog n=1 Tax=Bactrocera neohumeralis TaxID=98809 RepID=UPI00216631EE|nr:facilitated trehalose transporter Tret1-2 homolog [Bactrocera neohumeralis]